MPGASRGVYFDKGGGGSSAAEAFGGQLRPEFSAYVEALRGPNREAAVQAAERKLVDRMLSVIESRLVPRGEEVAFRSTFDALVEGGWGNRSELERNPELALGKSLFMLRDERSRLAQDVRDLVREQSHYLPQGVNLAREVERLVEQAGKEYAIKIIERTALKPLAPVRR